MAFCTFDDVFRPQILSITFLLTPFTAPSYKPEVDARITCRSI
jgi:hypothetical protein